MDYEIARRTRHETYKKPSFSVVFCVEVGLSSVKTIGRFSAASITATQRWTNLRHSAVFVFSVLRVLRLINRRSFYNRHCA
jgi:hypothetical protein